MIQILHRRAGRAGLVIAALLAATPTPAVAAGDGPDVLERFVGRWSGAGTVRRNEASGAQSVNCGMRGHRRAGGLNFAGTCRALLIFSRSVSVDVAPDGRGRLVGSYSGSAAGTAALTETARDATSVVFRVDWPKPVYGDTVAEMRISVTGTGFRLTVVDDVAGAPERVTDLAFEPGA